MVVMMMVTTVSWPAVCQGTLNMHVAAAAAARTRTVTELPGGPRAEASVPERHSERWSAPGPSLWLDWLDGPVWCLTCHRQVPTPAGFAGRGTLHRHGLPNAALPSVACPVAPAASHC